MDKTRRYVGIYHDNSGGMTTAGNIIRDAWVFGLLPEEETCEGWMHARMRLPLYGHGHRRRADTIRDTGIEPT